MNDTAQTMFDFSERDTPFSWESIDDRIMGGLSKSSAEITTEGCLRFAGTVSLENDGGFASIRCANGDFDVSGGKQVKLRVKGDGKTYKFGMRIDIFFDGVTYLSKFATRAGEWQEVSLPLAAFQPFHHGRQLANAAPLDPARVKSFVILIGDRQEGTFRLDVDWIKVV